MLSILLNRLEDVDLNDDLNDDLESEASCGSGVTSIDSDESETLGDVNDGSNDEIRMEDEVKTPDVHSWSNYPKVDRSAFAFTATHGVHENLMKNTNPTEIFESFIGEEIIDLIVNETNKYAANCNEEKRRSGKMRKKSRDLMWTETNPGEIRVALAIAVLQGIVQKPNIDDYHSTNPLIHTPIFGKMISRDRLKLIFKYLHFSDLDKSNDPLYKLRNLLNLFVSRFQANYTPERNISIDDSLMLWNRRLSWKRSIHLSADKFWLEAFALAETKSGYVWNIEVYTGKEPSYQHNIANVQKVTNPSKIVLHLAKPLLNKGYCIGMNNYYASPELFDILVANQTDAVGTARYNSKNLSPVVTKAKLEKGETVSQYRGKLIHLKWKDKEDVNMLSTIHNEEIQKITIAGKDCLKPTIFIEYKKNHMARVDLMDRITSATSLLRRKVKKYYKKMFFRLIELCFQNAYCIYKKNGGSKTLLLFKLQLIEDIFGTHAKDVYWTRKPNAVNLGSCTSRLNGRHFIEPIKKENEEKKFQRKCRYCTLEKKVKRTIYWCEICNIPLCIYPCFKLYHTVEELPQLQ